MRTHSTLHFQLSLKKKFLKSKSLKRLAQVLSEYSICDIKYMKVNYVQVVLI